MELYGVRQLGVDAFRVVRFDDYFNVLRIYVVYRKSHRHLPECSCGRAVCRHRTIVGLFQDQKKVDTGWFLSWDSEGDNHTWERPLNDPVRMMRQRRESTNDAT